MKTVNIDGVGYKPLPMSKRIMCPSCHKVHMSMWALPFDDIWHCDGCNNTIVADKRTTDWAKLVGTRIRCKFGGGNHMPIKHDMIIECEVLNIRGNEVRIHIQHNANSTWYTIYDGYVGEGSFYSGWHLVRVV